MGCKNSNEMIQNTNIFKSLRSENNQKRNNQRKMYFFLGVRKRKQLFHLQYERNGIAGNELSQLGSHTNR